MIAGNLCRCTGYQNIVKSVLRAAESSVTGSRHGASAPSRPAARARLLDQRRGLRGARRRQRVDGVGRMTTKLFGTPVQRVEDQRFLRGQRAVRRRRRRRSRTTLHAAVLRSPHAHAKVLDVHVEDVLDIEGVHVVWTYEDLAGLSPPMAEPLPLLIPHPTLTHGRTQYALANGEVNYVGEAIAFVVADDRYVAEDAVGRIRVDYEVLPPVVGIEAARAATNLVHEDVPGNVGARMEQHNGDARGRDHGRAAHADPRPDRRAQRLPADGGPRHRRPLGPRRQPADRVVVDPDLDRGARRGRGQARPRPRPGRRGDARRGRRLRGEDQPPVARGAARPARRAGAGPAGEVHRGPPRALHLLGPRARPGAPRRGRLRRRRSRSSGSTCSSGTTTAPTRRTA